MKKDISWSDYFADARRFADLVNVHGCGGEQLVSPQDVLMENPRLSLRMWMNQRWRDVTKFRDEVRRVIFNTNVAVVGFENQETIDYSYPLREMGYTYGEYEKQAKMIRKTVRSKKKELKAGEWLYGFKKTSRLFPSATFLLYSGEEPWDGPIDLYGMIDFTDIPDKLRGAVQNYKINLIDIHRLDADTLAGYKTDIGKVFDYIKRSASKDALLALVENDPYFSCMPEDAFLVVINYTNSKELIHCEDYLEEDRADMCRAIHDLIEDGRSEGIQMGRSEGIQKGIDTKTRQIVTNMLSRGMKDEDIIALAECKQSLIDELRAK